MTRMIWLLLQRVISAVPINWAIALSSWMQKRKRIDVVDAGKLRGVDDISFCPDVQAYVAVTGGSVIATYKPLAG